MTYIFAGDSWAWKGYTKDNYDSNQDQPQDVCLADFWGKEYQHCARPGQGNLDILEQLRAQRLSPQCPIVWIYTEPGRDSAKINGTSAHDWIINEPFFGARRRSVETQLFLDIQHALPNPIAWIGGLSDIPKHVEMPSRWTVLHHSWQRWIADRLNSQWFIQGWGASDVGWRMHADAIVPSREMVFAWDQQIKEWCWWEEHGYFCHEHPTPEAHRDFAEYLKPTVLAWLALHS
jgi:hypothetical protein